MLFLPNGADHSVAAYAGWFKRHAKEHARAWLDFVKSTDLITDDHPGIIFVTGHHLTDKWATAVVRNCDVEAEGRLGLSLSKVGGAFSIKSSKTELFELPLRVGPKIKHEGDDCRNQCVFLNGYAIIERGIRSFKMKAAAAPKDLDMDRDADSCSPGSPSNSSSEDESDFGASDMVSMAHVVK